MGTAELKVSSGVRPQAEGLREPEATKDRRRRLVAVVFTDVVGYTAMMQTDEEATRVVRLRHREVVEAAVDTHDGELIQYFGDGSLSIFPSTANAVAAGIRIQQELCGEVPLRVGIHQGEVAFDEQGVYGDCVNIASRVMGLGISGSVIISGKADDELKNRGQFLTRSLGNFLLKNVRLPLLAFAVVDEALSVPTRADVLPDGYRGPIFERVPALKTHTRTPRKERDLETPPGTGSENLQVERLKAELAPELTVLRLLGEGQMATVHLAREVELDRLVAVKVLRPEAAENETTRRRFNREARAAASMAHPNVVSVYRVGRLSDSTPFLVMQYVQGRSMAERLQAGGPLRPAVARTVLHDIAAALTAAHAHDIIHRDLRPENVLWDAESERALLTDFGIATMFDSDGAKGTRLTRRGELIGNPRYLSPEHLGEGDITPQADVYSFAVLAYELLCGEPPFDATSVKEWITAHMNGTPRRLIELQPDADPRLDDLLWRCLNKKPLHRPSAADLARALGESAVSSEVLRVASDTGTGGLGLGRRRLPQIVSGATVFGLGLLQVVATLTDDERSNLPPIAFDLALYFVVVGVSASGVVGWFHGEKGRQKAPFLEYVILGMLTIIWVGVSLLRIFGRGL